MQYSFVLKDNNQKAYGLFTWFLFFLHGLAAAIIASDTAAGRVNTGVYVLLGYYAVSSVVFFFVRRRKHAMAAFSSIMALGYAVFWLTQEGIVALLIFTAVYLLVTVVQYKKTTAFFSLQGVHVTRVFKTDRYPWQHMDNVILKDGLLTIDFKSNKIMQSEIEAGAIKIEEERFNRFCSEQMQQGGEQ